MTKTESTFFCRNRFARRSIYVRKIKSSLISTQLTISHEHERNSTTSSYDEWCEHHVIAKARKGGKNFTDVPLGKWKFAELFNWTKQLLLTHWRNRNSSLRNSIRKRHTFLWYSDSQWVINFNGISLKELIQHFLCRAHLVSSEWCLNKPQLWQRVY